MNDRYSPKIGLALGGGITRVLAHVGAIEVLTLAGIQPDLVVGASAGSLVGAAFAAGMPIEELIELAMSIKWLDIGSLTLDRQGFVSFHRLEKKLVELVGDLDFEDMAIPFAAVAVDLENGTKALLNQGRVARAVRASCSVPGFIVPANIDGRMLADGGVVESVPVASARELGADYVIGVDLHTSKFSWKTGMLMAGFSALEMLFRQAGGGVESADTLIVPDLTGCGYIRFHNRTVAIERGREAARALLPKIMHDLQLSEPVPILG